MHIQNWRIEMTAEAQLKGYIYVLYFFKNILTYQTWKNWNSYLTHYVIPHYCSPSMHFMHGIRFPSLLDRLNATFEVWWWGFLFIYYYAFLFFFFFLKKRKKTKLKKKEIDWKTILSLLFLCKILLNLFFPCKTKPLNE